MITRINSCAIIGLDCQKVEIEIDIAKGNAVFLIVGLPDTSIQEAKERIHSALKNSGLSFPYNKRQIINLAPADLHKGGAGYDLAMVAGIIVNILGIKINLEKSLFIGELSLDGRVKHINGILSVALFCRQNGYENLYLSTADFNEASLVQGINIIPINDLKELTDHLLGNKLIEIKSSHYQFNQEKIDYPFDFKYIYGQENAKRALEIACAGAHNLIMNGPPGSGKSLLAKAIPSILPTMTEKEILEVTKIYSIAGLLPANKPVIDIRPFRSPHHSASGAALVGGGRFPRPGEISLAHRGVLFLDEFCEFPKLVLEHLRQPLEDGAISIARAQGTINFPAKFMLVAAQNPCPCGYSTDLEKQCCCTPNQISTYQKKISGPIMDRLDIYLEVPRVNLEKLTSNTLAEESSKIKKRVEEARERQKQRLQEKNMSANSEMGVKEIGEFCQLGIEELNIFKKASTALHLSARAFHRVLKLARTIADLEQKDKIAKEHLAEALQYREK